MPDKFTCSLFLEWSQTEFWLQSNGETLSIHSDKLGVYVPEERSVNDKQIYKHRDNKFYFYWINEYGGYWMVSKTHVRHDIVQL